VLGEQGNERRRSADADQAVGNLAGYASVGHA